MRFKLIFRSLFICSIFFFACSEGSEERGDIIEKDKMIQILADLQVFESTSHFIEKIETDYNVDESYLWVYKEYDITAEQFKTSLEYYASDPKVIEEMYDEVIIILSEKQVEITE